MPYQNQIHLIRSGLEHASKAEFATSVGLIAFAVIFLFVGISRVVEFNGLGLSTFRRRILGVLHIVGCVIFALSLILVAVDLHRHFDRVIGSILLSSLTLLFPIHLYIGVLRRMALQARSRKT